MQTDINRHFVTTQYYFDLCRKSSIFILRSKNVTRGDLPSCHYDIYYSCRYGNSFFASASLYEHRFYWIFATLLYSTSERNVSSLLLAKKLLRATVTFFFFSLQLQLVIAAFGRIEQEMPIAEKEEKLFHKTS